MLIIFKNKWNYVKWNKLGEKLCNLWFYIYSKCENIIFIEVVCEIVIRLEI